MPYHIYHSEAIIVGYENRGESDRDILVFSRVHGLIRLRARSIRRNESKLRYTMLPFRLVVIDYLRAKNGWKITSAIPQQTFYALKQNKRKRTLAALQFRLLRRMVHGEERHQALFAHLEQSLELITRLSDHQLAAGELLLTIRLLDILGYWGGEMAENLRGDISDHMLSEISVHRSTLIPLVNSALRMTHL
jgi:DNA repair protein RecO